MPGTEKPAFQSNELHALESGRRTDGSWARRKESATEAAGYFQMQRIRLERFVSGHPGVLRFVYLAILNLAVLNYFVFATLYWSNYNYEHTFDWGNGYGLLIIVLAIVYGGIFYNFAVTRVLGTVFDCCRRSAKNLCGDRRNAKCGAVCQAVIYVCSIGAIVAFLVIDTADSRERLMSGIGVITLMTFGWMFSKHPGRINWRPVFCGLILQFVFGILAIRWPVGRAIFQCLADKVEGFLNFAKHGAKFIFSDQLVDDGVFAFSVLTVIFYFSSIIQILYYLGAMQWIILSLGQLLQSLMGTSICESVNCAANIFIGMTESPLVIKPYLSRLTSSELHTIMCSGFATVSGTVLAAYIKFGANPAHLITASLMAAPATLCYSKLFYPETEKSMLTAENIKLEKSKDAGLIDAASKGAMAAIPLVMGIIANIVAFVSFIALINSLLGWIGSLVGYEGLAFELILSKVFMPLSWIMGVPWDQCGDVATLIGLKTVVNEFVAYERLGQLKEQGRIYGRTEAIATFAICGFANPGSLGITLSMLTSLAPNKRESITSAITRAFVAGSAVCFLTASIAGMLISDDYYNFTTSGLAATNVTRS